MNVVQQLDLYAALRERLIRNGFAHGMKLKPEEIRADYGCSASTLREVLFRLSTEGLVQFQEQRGFRVPERSAQKLTELTHLRILLEGEGTALSIARGGVDWEARLTAAHHKLSHIEKRIHARDEPAALIDIWFSSEKEFHQTLISACGSETLQASHDLVYARFRQQLMVADMRFDFISENIKQHAGILEAAVAGDAPLARRRIHDHLCRHMTTPAPFDAGRSSSM